MADLWDRFKDFAYRNSPGAARQWVDDNRTIAQIAARMEEASERDQALGVMQNEQRWPHWNAGIPDREEPVISRADEHLKAIVAAARDGIADAKAGETEKGFHYIKTWENGTPVYPGGAGEPGDTVRLYRVGPLPDQSRDAAPRWIREYEDRMGLSQNIGRWFTSDEAAAEQHRFQHPASVMRHVDVTPEQAHAWRADTLKLERYTDAPALDFFLPREVANTAQVTGAERQLVPDPPAHQPTQTVDYVETQRFFNKHNAREPIDLNRAREERQQSWTWER